MNLGAENIYTARRSGRSIEQVLLEEEHASRASDGTGYLITRNCGEYEPLKDHRLIYGEALVVN